MQDTVRWNIKVSRETDVSLRSLLGGDGIRRGDLSRFIERAVRAEIFNRNVMEMKANNMDIDPGELEDLIDATVREVRAERAAELTRQG